MRIMNRVDALALARQAVESPHRHALKTYTAPYGTSLGLLKQNSDVAHQFAQRSVLIALIEWVIGAVQDQL
jgi:hypothetical protein